MHAERQVSLLDQRAAVATAPLLPTGARPAERAAALSFSAAALYHSVAFTATYSSAALVLSVAAALVLSVAAAFYLSVAASTCS